MIKLENYEVLGWEHAVRGMRNPMNSWKKSDSVFKETAVTEEEIDGPGIRPLYVQYDALSIGENDRELMMKLANAGPVHGKFRRMITVYVDITAPLYWWKEFDTYKVGTVANSCSTMHKIHEKEFTSHDFSIDHLSTDRVNDLYANHPTKAYKFSEKDLLDLICVVLNNNREKFLETKDKKYWWQMIQLLPSSYNQKRTVQLNYEVLANIYKYRKNHKLDEWVKFCEWIEQLPYSEIITGEKCKGEIK